MQIKRHSVVLNFQPDCPTCIEARWRVTAELAGLEMLGRDPDARSYGIYRAACGHEIRRQFPFIQKMARGETDARCETCHAALEQAEAREEGWELLGSDPQGDVNYRLYRHADGCGAEGRIARVNMQTGRFTCPGCGDCWSTEPSYLYAMKFELTTGVSAIKLGFSRNPTSRLRHQLHRHPDLKRDLLLQVSMRTGRHAQRVEKRLHKWLANAFPGEILEPEEFSGELRVKSELYRAGLEETILRQLRRVQRKEEREAKRSRIKARARSERLRPLGD
ncbi:GIY-YIG nuclease family protein [Thioclava sp. DLFJ5-1]|uniref:GIY-YIG nuclease family protein n=1 Tax=Thioclava sp. DLFJ5-1 TaxID=1915314 RepID=UPI001AF001D2|nr:GIY-YIG nuclease family protein [Thioclava sp. DLFJ5-1]